MTKRNLFVRILIAIILIAMMMPSFYQRIKNESKNTDVIFALNYNNASMLLSGEEMERSLEENQKIGVRTALVAEESINSLISAGYLTAIKYNVLCHKYDDESEEIIKSLADNEKIHNDSYVLISKRDDCKEYLERWITSKYTKNEYVKKTTPLGADVYVIYEGVSDAWHIPVGFDESKLEAAAEHGFRIVLSMMVTPYSNTDYIDEIAALCEKYDIKYLNLKEAYKDYSENKNAKKNYSALSKLIKDRNMYLILTEEQTQLSNQKPVGYNALIESARGRVLRGYDSIDIDAGKSGSTVYEKRYSQILNSVVDRNIRFVCVNQLTNGNDTIAEKSEKTNLATKKAVEKLNFIGYNTQSYSMQYDYSVNRTLTSAAAMLLMILMGLTMLEWLFEKRLKKLEVLAAIGAVLSVGFTYIAPEGIVLLYPTLFAVIAPCFAITATMVFVKNMREKLSNISFFVSSTAAALLSLILCATVQTALLSGLDYYLNSIIFRGIKLSLIVPIVYSCIAFIILFTDKREKLSCKIIKVLNAQIKVYWILIGLLVIAVAAIYLIRSGNVSSISPLESLMRNTITEMMTARPRTKEFLVGWPALMLFLYYIKNTRCVLLQWGFAAGSSILFASVINSFCHVFTSANIIYMRVFNGLFIGLVVSAAALIINHIALCAVKKLFKAGN